MVYPEITHHQRLQRKSIIKMPELTKCPPISLSHTHTHTSSQIQFPPINRPRPLFHPQRKHPNRKRNTRPHLQTGLDIALITKPDPHLLETSRALETVHGGAAGGEGYVFRFAAEGGDAGEVLAGEGVAGEICREDGGEEEDG